MSDVDTTRELDIFKFGDLGKGEVETIEISVHGKESDGGHVSKTLPYKDVQKALESYRALALDDLLEAMPDDLRRSKNLQSIKDSLLGDYDERIKNLIGIARIRGHNMCLEAVTATIHQLKSSKKGADDE